MSRSPGRSYHPRGRQDAGMPLRLYFLGVGGVLLALLFAADGLLPRPSATGIVSGTEPPRIRIHSERKGPEAIVFDTTQPTIVPSAGARPEADVADATVAAPEAAVRRSFAHVVAARPAQAGGDAPRKISAKISARHPHKREVAMFRTRPSLSFAAETGRFGFFRMAW